jgi:voltage-gated potassium channel Kch
MGNNEDFKFYRQTGTKIFLVAGSYILFGAIVYHLIEKISWVDSFYFVVVTLGTIGYGDIVPKTNGGKLFTIFFVIFGLAIFSTLITNIISRSRERRERKLQR